jgi:hypothetical protein
MDPIILRDQDAARQYLLQGLWFQRAVHPAAATVIHALEWSLTIADAGQPLPPPGFVADIGHAALGIDRENKSPKDAAIIPGWPPGIARTYEDHVLGKIYADRYFERASDALKQIAPEKRSLGLAYIVKQIRERGDIGGVEMSPGIIRSLLDRSVNKPDELLRRGWEMLVLHGPMKLLTDMYDQIIAAARRMAEVLADEDVVALEQRTALLSMGEYVAHRQIWQTAIRLEESLPKHKIRPLQGRQEVATRVLDDDIYPVGGFASISTRGSVESLLHSQLAYMETEKELQPDLFDIKFLRDELYYYSRDENQFLRRRRTFVFALAPDLVQARFKDADLPCQRIVLVQAFMLAAVRKLSEWLSSDALKFEFLFVKADEKSPLEEESKLLALIFRELMENDTVAILSPTANDIEGHIRQRASRSMCHCLVLGAKGLKVQSKEAVVTEMRINGPRPSIGTGNESVAIVESDEPFDSWTQTLIRLLELWI